MRTCMMVVALPRFSSHSSLGRLEPGQKQLVRLIRQSAPPAGVEQAYRVVLDEIPTPRSPGENHHRRAGDHLLLRLILLLAVNLLPVEDAHLHDGGAWCWMRSRRRARRARIRPG
jgi:hypothetical protein